MSGRSARPGTTAENYRLHAALVIGAQDAALDELRHTLDGDAFCAAHPEREDSDGIPSLAMPTQIVVAAAVISGSRVLVAQRARPAELAGRWELPGGKVAPGEAECDALARELAEELGCRSATSRWATASAATSR